jgi:RHS repeat-associated protein
MSGPSAAGLGGPAKYWQSYGYDVLGNRTSLVEHATATGDRRTNYTVPDGRHLLTASTTTDDVTTTTRSYTYDTVGNMITRSAGPAGPQTMTWDVEGRLATSVDGSGTTSYIYDADGSRLIRQDPAGRTLYLPDQELRVTASGGVKTATRYYNHAGAPIAVRSGAGLTWLSGDAQGTAQISVAATNQAVAVRRQTPFGTARGATGTWPSAMDKGFVGGTNDNTGLVHLGAREYEPASGRFISRDPVINTDDPQQMNGYAYSNNAPVTTSDPTGRLGSASCPIGFVGGPGACTGKENQPPLPAPYPPSPPPCKSQSSASNCDKPDSGYKGPCDSKHSASNCGPKTSPWDIIQIIWYSNGTRLVIYRNGRVQINGAVLPEGVVDPEAMAARIDKDSRRDEPDDILVTLGKVYNACNPHFCTVEFRNQVRELHWALLDEAMKGGIGICVSGVAFYGAHWGGELCVYVHDGAGYATLSGSRGWGWDLAGGVSVSGVETPTMSDLCGHATYANGSVGPFSSGVTTTDDGGLLTVDVGVGKGVSPGAFSAGASHGYFVWQFGKGEFGDNICNN